MMSKFKNLFLLVICFLYSLKRGQANRPPANPKKFLILRFKPHVGDVVYITPLFRAIKAKYLRARLYVLGAGRVQEVIANNPDIDEYLQYQNNFWVTVRRLRKENLDFACLANAGSSEGLALLYLADVKSISTFSSVNDQKIPSLSYKFLSKLTIGQPFYTGQYVPPQYLKLLEPIGIKTDDCHFHLYFSAGAKEAVNKILAANKIYPERDFLIGIAPGGSTEDRWWPAERFAKLAEYLMERYKARIFLVGAGKDEKPINEILRLVKPEIRCVNLLNQSLDEFKATISQLRLIIGNDSGPMVTADAFDVANIVLVGPTDPREYHRLPGPLNRVVVAEDRIMASISLQTVIGEVDSVLHVLQKQKILIG